MTDTEENVPNNISMQPCTEGDVANAYYFTFIPGESCAFYEGDKLIALANVSSPYDVRGGTKGIDINALESMEEQKGYGTQVIKYLFNNFDIDFIEGEYWDIAYPFWHRLGATKEDEITPIEDLTKPDATKTQDYFILTKEHFIQYLKSVYKGNGIKSF